MTNDGASRYFFPGSARALACRFRRLAEMVLLSNQECRWRGANDSTRGRVRSPRLESQRPRPTRRFEVEDFVKQNQRRRSPLGAQGRALCFGANIGRFFLWWQPCRLHPLIASDTPGLYRPNEGDGASTERRGYSIKLACDTFRLAQPRFLRFVLLALLAPRPGRGFPSSKSTVQFLPGFLMSKRARSRHLAAV